MKLLVADDHPVFRKGLVALLKDELGGVEVVETGDVPSTVTQVRDGAWDLLVLDLGMPGGDPIEMVETIRHLDPRLKILIVSAMEEGELAVRLLRAGVDGYFHKSRSPDLLVGAVRKVLGGGRYVGPDLAEALADRLDPRSEAPPHERLSRREFQVLRRLGAGESVAAIGEALHLSAKTVSTYRARLLDKLGLENNAQLVRYAVEHELLD